jgi:hypothetical protein
MADMQLLDSLTTSITITPRNRGKRHLVEVFIKDEQSIWYALLKYSRLPDTATITKDVYVKGLQSPRPYMPLQVYDPSTTSCILHLYSQLCTAFEFDPVGLYNNAYPDSIFTKDQLDAILIFAQWQGVHILETFDKEVIRLIIKALYKAKYGALAQAIHNALPF